MVRTSFAAALAALLLGFAAPQLASAQEQSRAVSRAPVGAWTVLGWVSPAGNGYCTAERASGTMQLAFGRYPQGYALILQSPAWKLAENGDYPVQLVAPGALDGDSRARVINEKTVIIAISQDVAVLRNVAGSSAFQVQTSSAKIDVPLDDLAPALTELDTCFTQRAQAAVNPFATPSAGNAPATPVVSRLNSLTEEQTFLTIKNGDKSYRLEAVIVKPANASGRLPVALITHGKDRALGMTAQRASWMLPQARDMAHRGYMAVAVVRRGYGLSDGTPGLAPSAPFVSCQQQDFEKAFDAEAEDLEAALRVIAERPDADGARMIAMGPSVGGGAVIALAARAPKGLVAAINVSGGMHVSTAAGPCQFEASLANAMRSYGSRTRVPTLWLYAENDKLFGPQLVRSMHAAYTGANGKATLKMFGPLGEDGHALFALAQGRLQYLTELDRFLRLQNLPTWTAAQLEAAMKSGGLAPTARAQTENYFAAPTPKVMVATRDGRSMFWQAAGGDLAEVRNRALETCQQKANTPCVVLMENFESASKPVASSQPRTNGNVN
jgi:dienelactone hydrolase